MNDLQQAQLWQVLQSEPPDGGLWNGPKVAPWSGELLGRHVSPQRGWEYLKGLRLRRRTPRPQHQKSSEAEQQEWKKKLATETVRVRKEHPDADVQVWAMDEHRLGLKPIVRKVWVCEGEQPNAAVNWQFKWLWLYGGVAHWWYAIETGLAMAHSE